jgi:hypothetical protein
VNSDVLPHDTEPLTRPVPTRRRALLVAGASVVLLALSACSTDPGARRVAEDIVETAVYQGDLTEAEGTCMFDKLEELSDDELEAINESAVDAGPGTLLDQFQADLAACKE